MRPHSHHADAIANRLSLRQPQRQSLDILDQLTSLISLTKGDADTKLSAIRDAFPAITDFERSFPNVCFALATGVGKTRLMGAFVTYLHIAHGINNFFILAPNLTVYDKLNTDFTPNTKKYVLQGIGEFASTPPSIVTGENYIDRVKNGGDLFPATINIFNISKVDAEVRSGRTPRIRSFREEIGESYFDYLANLDDLVLIMDESHRYRASAGVRVLNELNPILGLELTATPFTEDGKKNSRFRNVIFDYPLARAMEDGFIKEPAVVTRENFVASGQSPDTIQRIKLEDGIRLHENVKAELGVYARQTGVAVVKPFVLVIARDTTHAAELLALIRSKAFFSGLYADRVIQIDSSTREDETISRLLQVERADEPTEIVIHVNMLKEGWDVTNLYTIVPLRAANARVLIEQSIGRGLRLPYGRRTGVTAIDRLNIVAHDRFQEIVDEARKPDSSIRLQQIILTESGDRNRVITITSEPVLYTQLGFSEMPPVPGLSNIKALLDHSDLPVTKVVYETIQAIGTSRQTAFNLTCLARKETQDIIVEETGLFFGAGKIHQSDLERIVETVAQAMIDKMIAIPQISVRPSKRSHLSLIPFKLDLTGFSFTPSKDGLRASHLRTGQIDVIAAMPAIVSPHSNCEDIIVSHLIAHDDIAYEDAPDILYALASDTVAHLRSYLSDDDVTSVVSMHGKPIADNIYRQIIVQSGPGDPVDYIATVTRGFCEMKRSAYTASADQCPLDFKQSPKSKNSIGQYIFCGFERCLYPLQKFHSDAERLLALILDRDALKWFRPALGQFDITYRDGDDISDYQPDFAAETANDLFILEVKAENEMTASDVAAKCEAAAEWCNQASAFSTANSGKPWSYILIPHTAVSENMTLDGLVSRFRIPSKPTARLK